MERKVIFYEIIAHNGTVVIGDTFPKSRYIGYTLAEAKSLYCRAKGLDIKNVKFSRI